MLEVRRVLRLSKEKNGGQEEKSWHLSGVPGPD
jgi:hypothetical protein